MRRDGTGADRTRVFLRCDGGGLREALRNGLRVVKVCFVELPAEKQVGGLEAAIVKLRETLPRANVAVVSEQEFANPRDDKVDVVHFHGLWLPRHSALSRMCRASGAPYVVSPHGMLEPWAWRHNRWKKLPSFCLRGR